MTTKETGSALELDVKSIAEDGTFEAYASIFGVMDLGKDIVKPGAFTNSLKTRPASKVKMLRNHDTFDPVGVWTSIIEDSRGLKVKGKLILGTVKGNETYQLMKAGALDSLSIGYRSVRESMDRKTGARNLEIVDLYEVSVVTFPMLESATISRVKSGDTDFARLVRAINRATSALH